MSWRIGNWIPIQMCVYPVNVKPILNYNIVSMIKLNNRSLPMDHIHAIYIL